MIKLPLITSNVIDEHWDYFINSRGFNFLKSYAVDDEIHPKERRLYRYFIKNNFSLLKRLVVGRPDELIEAIQQYLELRKEIPSNNLFYTLFNKVNNQYEFIQKNNQEIEYIYTQILDYSSKDKELDEEVDKYRKSIKTQPYKKQLQRSLKYSLQKSKKNILSFDIRLTHIFNYDSFVSGSRNWGAYSLVEKLNIRVCPYCNRSFIDIINCKEGKTRPELDHFYPKSKYPFLALSIYNLIPSCHVCNASFKGDEDFYTKEYVHPYIHSFHELAKFKIKQKRTDWTLDRILDLTWFNEEIKYELKYRENVLGIDKVKRTIGIFQLDKLYKLHNDYAQEINTKSQLYNSARLKDLRKFKLPNIEGEDDSEEDFFNDNDFARLVLGNYTDPSKFNMRPLSKFMYDIADETGLLRSLGIKYKDH